MTTLQYSRAHPPRARRRRLIRVSPVRSDPPAHLTAGGTARLRLTCAPATAFPLAATRSPLRLRPAGCSRRTPGPSLAATALSLATYPETPAPAPGRMLPPHARAIARGHRLISGHLPGDPCACARQDAPAARPGHRLISAASRRPCACIQRDSPAARPGHRPRPPPYLWPPAGDPCAYARQDAPAARPGYRPCGRLISGRQPETLRLRPAGCSRRTPRHRLPSGRHPESPAPVSSGMLPPHARATARGGRLISGRQPETLRLHPAGCSRRTPGLPPRPPPSLWPPNRSPLRLRPAGRSRRTPGPPPVAAAPPLAAQPEPPAPASSGRLPPHARATARGGRLISGHPPGDPCAYARQDAPAARPGHRPWRPPYLWPPAGNPAPASGRMLPPHARATARGHRLTAQACLRLSRPAAERPRRCRAACG